MAIGRVHAGAANKTSDQHVHGKSRIEAAERIGDYWQDRLGTRERNNLAIQKAIGTIQMGGPWSLRAFRNLPVSLSLYAKLIVYSFFYGAYRRFYFYAQSEPSKEMSKEMSK